MIRPFEVEIVRQIRTPPRRVGPVGDPSRERDCGSGDTFKTWAGTTFIECIRDGDPS